MTIEASQRHPLIIVVEDLHWVDVASTALSSLVEGLDRIPVLMLFTYRPGYTLPWLDRSFTTQIALQPLTPGGARPLIGSMTESAPVPDPVADLIIRRAEGNPFFLEELARAVAEHDWGRAPGDDSGGLARRASTASRTAPGACSRRRPCWAAVPRSRLLSRDGPEDPSRNRVLLRELVRPGIPL